MSILRSFSAQKAEQSRIEDDSLASTSMAGRTGVRDLEDSKANLEALSVGGRVASAFSDRKKGRDGDDVSLNAEEVAMDLLKTALLELEESNPKEMVGES